MDVYRDANCSVFYADCGNSGLIWSLCINVIYECHAFYLAYDFIPVQDPTLLHLLRVRFYCLARPLIRIRLNSRATTRKSLHFRVNAMELHISRRHATRDREMTQKSVNSKFNCAAYSKVYCWFSRELACQQTGNHHKVAAAGSPKTFGTTILHKDFNTLCWKCTEVVEKVLQMQVDYITQA